MKSGTYDKWALDASDAFNKAGIHQTPTIRLNGKNIQEQDVPGVLARLK